MKIALLHEMLTKLGGAERVLKKLSDLFPNAPIYTLLHDTKVTQEWFGTRQIHTSGLQSVYEIFKRPKYLLPRMNEAIEKFDFSDFDVVISSSSAFAHGIRTNKQTRHICYCHSPMRYAWDYTHAYRKQFIKPIQFGIATMLNSIRQWDYRVSGRPKIIIANSRHVQKRIAKFWRKESTVIYPPVNVDRFTPTSRHNDTFLIVSTLTPFKRIDLAIHAFNKNGRKLLIVGDGGQRKHLESIAGSNITFLGRKSDNEVRTYYENCRAFIFPGEEDFGITPVEAMATGKPVLAYGKGGATESVQAGLSGEFFSEPTPDALNTGLNLLLTNENQYDIQKIRQVAEKFSETVFEEKIRTIL